MRTILDVENTVTTRDGKLHLDPFEADNSLTMIGYGNADTDEKPSISVFDHAERQSDTKDAVQDVLDKTTLLIMHNAQHDLQWLWACGFKYDGKIYDTMLAEYVLARGLKRRLSLKDCAERYDLQYAKQDTLKEYFKKGYSTRDIPFDDLCFYLDGDILVTRALFQTLEHKYKDEENHSLHNVLDITNNVCKTLTRMYMNGVKIDKAALDAVQSEFENEKAEIKQRLEVYVEQVMGDTPINLNSPEQVSQLIFSRKVIDKHIWGEDLFAYTTTPKEFTDCVDANTEVLYKTKAYRCGDCRGQRYTYKTKKDGTLFKKPNKCTNCDAQGYLLKPLKEKAGLKFDAVGKTWVSANGFSTSKKQIESLEVYARSNDWHFQANFLGDLRRLSALESYLSSFVNGIRIFTKDDDYLHVGLTQHITSTGRFSGRNPNMQNMPRGNTFPVKRVFTSRWDGGKIMEADFAQLEFRVAAFLAQDKTAMDEVATGFDVHSYTAKVITDAGQETSRQDAKAHTFAPLYGASGYGRTPAEAKYYTHFNEKYKGIAAWHITLANEAMDTNRIQTPSGRQYEFEHMVRRGDRVSNFTMIKNYPVQGFATGCIVPVVMMEFEKELDNMQSCLVNTVHDSIVVDVHPDEIDEVIAAVATINSNLHDIIYSYYDVDFNVPLLLEAKIGDNWLDTKDV